jgi:very-short-patch-repair endonuclease
MAITSKEINLAQLTKELGGKGLIADFNDPKKKLILPADGVELTDDELKAAIAAHVAIDEKAERDAKRQEILDRLGLTANEAKLLIG